MSTKPVVRIEKVPFYFEIKRMKSDSWCCLGTKIVYFKKDPLYLPRSNFFEKYREEKDDAKASIVATHLRVQLLIEEKLTRHPTLKKRGITYEQICIKIKNLAHIDLIQIRKEHRAFTYEHLLAINYMFYGLFHEPEKPVIVGMIGCDSPMRRGLVGYGSACASPPDTDGSIHTISLTGGVV